MRSESSALVFAPPGRLVRAIPHILLIAAIATLLVIVRQWAYVTTYRLYLDQRVDDARNSTAAQRFDIEDGHVVPKIVMTDDRVSFRAAVGRDSTILAIASPASRTAAVPAGPSRYEIHIRQDGVDRTAARGEVTEPTPIECRLPTGNGVIEVVAYGPLVWSDLRLRRDLHIAPELWLLTVLLGAAILWVRALRPRRTAAPTWTFPSRASHPWFAMLVIVASVVVAIFAMELGLRAVGSRVSSGISAARHDLGELTEDPRWQVSPRYGRRINANVNAMNEWRYGDIVRMGFISPSVSEGLVHRYPLHTDREGFRNNATRDHIEVAALGDSFTDALTMPVESAWPSQLEQMIGLPVQNYGTAGFGPQQELLVLKDYAAHHEPRVVVLAFFAGNDIHDAEAFEAFQKTGGKAEPPTLGWPIKDIVSRADTWYVVNAVHSAVAVANPSPSNRDTQVPGAPPPTEISSPRFDRGMFAVPVNGSTLRWAFMPPYLNLLTFSESDLAARPGWALTRDSLIAMQRVSHDIGAEFVLLFLPFKTQVYLPLLSRTFSRDDLARAFQFYLNRPMQAKDVEEMARHRLAHNALMSRFCEEAGIPFLDMTTALQMHVDAGENMYFPDDSHLNEAGAAVVAQRLAEFLQDRALVSHAGAAPER